MKQCEKDNFSALLSDVMAFYKQDVTPFALDVWWAACLNFEYEQVKSALTRHVMDAEKGVFAPKPADLVRKLEGTTTDRASLAWGKVYEAMQRVGAYTDIVFDDEAIHAVIDDLGGWPIVCRVDGKNLSYMQDRFCKSYRAYAEAGQFDYARILIGDRSPDDVFEKRGLKPPKPAVIGNVEKARLVYKGGKIGAKTSIGYYVASEIGKIEGE